MNLKEKFACVQMTDVGKVRDHNEDAIGANLGTGLLVLADGMGGYNAGEVASGIAVKTVLELVSEACAREDREVAEPETGLMRQSIVLRDAVARANKIIHQTAKLAVAFPVECHDRMKNKADPDIQFTQERQH